MQRVALDLFHCQLAAEGFAVERDADYEHASAQALACRLQREGLLARAVGFGGQAEYGAAQHISEAQLHLNGGEQVEVHGLVDEQAGLSQVVGEHK